MRGHLFQGYERAALDEVSLGSGGRPIADIHSSGGQPIEVAESALVVRSLVLFIHPANRLSSEYQVRNPAPLILDILYDVRDGGGDVVDVPENC